MIVGFLALVLSLGTGCGGGGGGGDDRSETPSGDSVGDRDTEGDDIPDNDNDVPPPRTGS